MALRGLGDGCRQVHYAEAFELIHADGKRALALSVIGAQVSLI